MTRLPISRRGFMVSTSAIAALAATAGPRAAFAQERLLRLRFDTDPEILDPAHMTGGTGIEVQYACLPILGEYTREGDTFGWQPSIYATKLEQRDTTHIDFELAEGLTWTGDNGPVTAADVKFSFERMRTGDWSGYFDAMDHVEVTGDRSGTIVLKQPFAPFIMTTLCHGAGVILSEKAVTAAGGTFTTEFPAVCGPYLYEHTPGQRAVFTLRPDWALPKPAFDRVECNLITEVKAAELAFEAGELDCSEVAPDTLARYQGGGMPPGAGITIAGELQYMWLGMNTEHPKLTDIKVRQAIQHAVDVDSIIAGAYAGTTTKSNGIICPGLIGHRDAAKYSYDPAKAQALLAEAGVSGLELTLRTLNLQERVLAAQIIQANLAAVGITVTVLPVDSGPFWEMGSESAGEQWKELEIWLMRFGTIPDPYEATQWFVSSQVGIWNWERWKSEEYDKLYQDGIAEIDPDKRRDIYLRMQDIMEETGAYVWINHEPEAFVHKTEIVINATPGGDQVYHRFGTA